MKKKFNYLIILALIIGILLGLFFPSFSKEISFLGTIYINLLKFMIGPILFTSVSLSVYSSSKGKNNLLLKIVLLFTIMFVLTFLITSLVVVIINPAKDFIITLEESAITTTTFDIKSILLNIFPNNLISIFAENSIFAIIIFSFIFGLSASKVSGSKEVMKFISGLKDIIFKILDYIIYLTPIGVIALISSTIVNHGSTLLGVGLKYIGAAYLSSLVVLLLVMILPVWIIAKVNPITYIKKVYKVWIVSMTTCSSSATMPYTIKTCNKEFNIPSEVTDIVVPLGTTIHMCGGAVSFALLGLFCSSLFGIEITFTKYVLMLISATLINMAAPGIPNGGIVIGATYLSMFNIPLTFMGFYTGIYKFLDMIYTTLNVTGDISSNIIVNKLVKNK